ncbi:vacuolar protein sorting-associated protein 8 homolog [Dendronephthya gigantea]|uniref:vacuolar protein sorting-associated protein 8 homolog n=1 Tax=Dendronephthya gigantea TaxID=151771 RepID=UPI00106C3B19|nr:vacuolar protein sorting-associated protein 8 homolog [Dendronephthya gigantea]XP_028409021.1 vacuolar protein sorting-associated protein 8 homolog [Dendronephthya gigantea]
MADKVQFTGSEDLLNLDGLLSVTNSLGSSILDSDTSNRSSSFQLSSKHDSSSAMVDLEMDLPTVKDMPTLESILNEEDDVSGLVVDITLEDILKAEKPSTSEANRGSAGETKHGSILRHVALKKISAQVQSASSRIEAGLPTAMAVSTIIAVGTSHGIVLIFDAKQTLQLVLGTTSQGAEYGAVTALGINTNSTRLLCGHAKGQITMWDLTTGKCVRSILDAHPPGSAVLHVLFTDDLTEAVCSDSGGSVFLLTFKKVIGVRTYDSQVVFSGSRGEVCVLAPLHFPESLKSNPLSERSLLALATLTKVVVLSLRPQFSVVFSFGLKGSLDSLPLLAWNFVVIQHEDSSRLLTPVLAFARESKIYFCMAHTNGDDDNIVFTKLDLINTKFKIISIHWLDSQLIGLVDALERIHLMDVRNGEILETLDLDSVQLVYSSSFFKSLSNGGNVSEALALASEHSCYQSVVGFNSQLLILGRQSIHLFTIRTWDDRISVFVNGNDFVGALKLALSFYNRTAKAVLGLIGSKEEKNMTVARMIENLIRRYVDKMLEMIPENKDLESLRSYFKENIPVCIDYCVAIGNIELLLSNIYDKFSSVELTKEVFLESLQSYIEEDRLVSLTPIVMKDFVGHYQKMGRLKDVERCLVHLDLVNLDIDQTVKLCWKYELYDAVIYVYNRGMADYGTPLEELLRILKETSDSQVHLNESTHELGYKLLVYISSCFAGRAYSVGNIPEELVKPVREQVARTLLKPSMVDSSNGDTYPNIRTLLEFDTAEFLNVLSLAFEEADFDEDCGVINCVAGRQRFIDVLLEVLVQGTGFTPIQVGSFFTFMARQMAKHSKISLNKVLFEQVLEYLSNPEDMVRHNEREQALLELLDSGALRQFDEERILVLAENGKFYQVCEILYIRRRQYGKVLSCYFRDQSRQNQAFEFVKLKMTDDSYTDLDRAELKQTVLENLLEFVAVDTRRTAHMIMAYFPDSLKWAIQKLEDQRQILYNFLKSVFDISESSLSKFEPPSDATTNETFIELMCEFESLAVYPHLRSSNNYRLQETLEIVKRFDIIDATAYLLEKSGDVKGAFALLLQALEKCVKNVDQGFINRVNSKEMSMALTTCKTTLLVIIQLCQRNSRRMDEYERENLWFPLLEVVMSPQRKLTDMTSDHFLAFKDLTRHVLNSMTGHISLPMILQKIMQDPTYNSGKFGEIRELIMGMLDTYSYEETLLTTTNHLLASDLHRSLSHMKGLLNRGVKPRHSICQLCQRPILMGETSSKHSDLIIFRCEHCCHTECLRNEFGDDRNWSCPICSKKNITRRVSASEERPLESTRTEKSKKTPTLSSEQIEALSRLRKNLKGPSRLRMLNELSKGNDMSGRRSRFGAKNLLQDDEFQLHLAPRFQFS